MHELVEFIELTESKDPRAIKDLLDAWDKTSDEVMGFRKTMENLRAMSRNDYLTVCAGVAMMFGLGACLELDVMKERLEGLFSRKGSQ